jgi:hypothetical protein
MAYNTVDDILEAVKINLKYEATGDFDDALTNLINGVLKQFEAYSNVSYTGVLAFETVQRADGVCDSLTIRYVPLATIDKFYMVGDVDHPYVSGEDFFFVNETGIIYIPSGIDVGLYYISGTYGFGNNGSTNLPSDVGLAAVMQTTFSWQKKDNLGKRSIAANTAMGSIAYEEGWQLLKGVTEILDKYVVI